MGFQSVVIIRNDALGEIYQHPEEFVKNLTESIQQCGRKGIDFACGHHGNPARVVAVHHADYTVVVASGGNTAKVLTTMSKWRWKDEIGELEETIKSIQDRIKQLRLEQKSKPGDKK